MKSKFIVVILLILTVAAASSLVRGCCQTRKYEQKSALNVYPVIIPEQVMAFQLTFGKKEVKLERKDGKWIVVTSQDALASGAAVSEFLTAFASTKPVRELETPDENILKKLNLSTDPSLEPGKGSGVTLKITMPDRPDITVFLGLAHIRKNETTASLIDDAGGSYDGRYVRVDDAEGKSHVFLLPRVFDNCIPDARVWMEPFRMVLDSGILSLQYRENGKMKWSVFQNRKTKNYELLPATGKVSLANLADRMDVLSKPFSGDIFRDDVSKLDFKYELTVTCRNGLYYRLLLSRIPGQKILAAKMEVHVVPALISRRDGESDENFTTRKNKFVREAEYLNQAFKDRIYMARPDLIDRVSPVPVESKDVSKK